MSAANENRAPNPLARANHAQRRAAQPESSAWVGASAGSGKTKVLTDRVLNLLLAGASPTRILCLTFTKAAAAEMKNRLARRLMSWATVEEADLRRLLEEQTGTPADEDTVACARRLFAQVLDAPGGLKIQTIHAFCQSLLARFPLEAMVPPNFQPLDEASAGELLFEAREEALVAAASDAKLAEALSTLVVETDEDRLDTLLGQIVSERARLGRTFARFGLEGTLQALAAALEIEPETSEADILAAGLADGELDREAAADVVRALAAGTAKEQEKAGQLRQWLESAPPARADDFETYRRLFQTKAGEPLARPLNKAADEAVPGASDWMREEAERLAALNQRVNAPYVFRLTASLLRVGKAILDAYENLKRARAALDYDDLILKTRDLLNRKGLSGWVLFKLDGGLDHVLIDEAQDTNPEQWEVVRLICEEFFAGEGAREIIRTVFAVGDAKQSIYSFQRADPKMFADMRQHFRERAEAAAQSFEKVTLDVSFRSTAAVLQAVDAVFARAEARKGLDIAEAEVSHHPTRTGHAGLVELWPPVKPEEARSLEPWSLPVTRSGEQPPALRLAEIMAESIRRWTLDPALADAPEAWLDSRGRRMRAGDVLVLVRRRNAFLYALVRALKKRGVPVSGVDRMVLTDELAVQDLVALGRFLLLPEDDLTLATVLRGPLIGLGEEALFDLAHGRDAGLWAALVARSGEREDFARAERRLSELMARVDYVPPYELYAEVLGAGGGRERLLARVGPEAAEPIDEFMSAALTYEREHAPALEGFLHWLERSAATVKREVEGADAGEVRIMTVHTAKGLQAPVVFLPDTTDTPSVKTPLFWPPGSTGLEAPVWSPRKGADDPVAAKLRFIREEADLDEYRRLLYVAMTRAEDRLYVCGWCHKGQKDHEPTEGSWYRLVEAGMADTAEAREFDFAGLDSKLGWRGPGWRLAGVQDAPPQSDIDIPADAGPAAPLPDFARAPAPAEPAPPRPLAPSRPASGEPAILSPLAAEDDGLRFRRGLLVHRLLELLPELPDEARPRAAERFLARSVHGLDPQAQAEIAAETLAVLDDPAFAPLFGPQSMAEVPVAGVVEGREGAKAVSGQLDRLAVTDDAVFIVDYKTNRPPPQDESEVSPVYLGQMAAYEALLRQVYPDRPIRCYLLWTADARLMQLSPEALAAHAP